MQGPKIQSGCIFCAALTQTDEQTLIIFRGQGAYVILNRYPYTNGHLMIVPVEHRDSLDRLNAEVRSEMMELLNQAIIILRKVYKPNGFNLGGNIGEAAGAGVADHVHLHVLPRWSGDTNFITAIGDTRVIPETVEETWHKLIAAWKD
jgi:ATP adenylyltransferase